MRDALLRRELKECAAVEVAHEHQASAVLQERQHDAAETRNVRPGDAQQRAFTVAESEALDPVQRGVNDAQMGEHRTLGLPGRAGRVEDPEKILLANDRCGWWLIGKQRLESGAVHAEAHLARGRLLARRQLALEYRFVDERARLRIADDVLYLRPPQPRADEYDRGAEARHRQHPDHGLQPIREHHRDPIALGDAARGQTGGKPVHAAVELAICEPRRAVDQGFGFGVVGHGSPEHRIERPRPLHVAAHDPPPMQLRPRITHGFVPGARVRAQPRDIFRTLRCRAPCGGALPPDRALRSRTGCADATY